MIVGVLVIVWVLVLRNLHQKKLMEDREKAGLVTPGPANFETIKKSLVEISQRLAAAESDYLQQSCSFDRRPPEAKPEGPPTITTMIDTYS
jgi:hypothetical protein